MKNLMFNIVWLSMVSANLYSQEYCYTSSTSGVPRPTELNAVAFTTHFAIHYTLIADNPSQTTLSHVENIKIGAEEAWTFLNSDGWQMPPDDGDGNSRYDIYVDFTAGGGGATFKETLLSDQRWTSYINISHLPISYTNQYCDQISVADFIKSVVLHELAHASQYNYKQYDNDEFITFAENCAMYLEWKKSQNSNRIPCEYSKNVNNPLSLPYLDLDYYSDPFNFKYTGSIWPLFLHQYYSANIVRNIWEYFSSHRTESLYSSMNNSLIQFHSSNLAEALRTYSVWKYFTGTRDDGMHFNIASMLPEVPLINDYNVNNQTVNGDQGNNQAQKISGIGGSQYIRFINDVGSPAFYDIQFNGVTGDPIKVSNIAINSGFSPTLYEMNLNSSNDAANYYFVSSGIGVLIPVATNYLNDPSVKVNYSFSITGSDAANITFKNELSNLSNPGGTLSLAGANYFKQISSGNSEWVDLNRLYSLKTDQERFINGSIIVKHQSWNNDFARTKLKRDNYQAEVIIEKADFISTIKTVVGNAFIDKPTLFADKIKFYDPWYLKDANFNQPSGTEYVEYDSPKMPTGAYNQSSAGIFSKDPNPLFPQYGLQAKQTISGAGFTGGFVNWSTTGGASVTEPSDTTTNASFLNNNDTIRALYKAQLATNSSNGYSSSSQRKILRTSDGFIHLVYTSAGKVWYEIGTESGGNITWQFMNGNQPLSGSLESKSPSIANDGNDVYIIYQEKQGTDNYKIVTHIFASTSSIYKRYLTSELSGYSTDAQPVIAINPNHQFVAVWKQSSGTAGLYYYCGTVEGGYVFTIPTTSGMLSNTTINSSTPTIEANKYPTNNVDLFWYFQVAYTHNSTIVYRKIQIKLGNPWIIENETTISTGNGFTYNYNPSIIPIADQSARVTWVGKRWEEEVVLEKTAAGGDGFWLTKAMFKDPQTSGTFWSFEQDVTSSNIQQYKSTNGLDSGYIVGWSAANGTNNRYTRSSSLSQTKSFGVNGADAQVIGGTSWSTMYGTFLNPTSTLYKIERSASVQTLGKTQSEPIYSGREGVIALNNAEFFFTLGDITVNGNPVEFEPKHDTLDVDSEALLNQYLITQPFTLTNQSNCSYSIQYGFTDSSAIASQLSENGFVKFKVELIDNATSQVIGSFDDVTYTQLNLFQYKKTGYNLNTEGIGTRTVRLRIVAHTNQEALYGLTNIVSSTSIVALGKKSIKRKNISYQGTLAVTEYALSQNYPNPFNPNTTINYALPKSGMVTLAVYDALGREVSVLVNNHQESGRYSVDFDASKLSSGMYIYKLTSGSFMQTKKMLLVK